MTRLSWMRSLNWKGCLSSVMRRILLLALIWYLASDTSALAEITPSDEQQCKPSVDGTCEGTDRIAREAVCLNVSAPSYCNPTGSLYSQRSVTAQAYRPDTPTKSIVCEPSKRRWKVASWPFWRGGRSHPTPTLGFRLKLFSCASSEDEMCCCSPLRDATGTTLEVWQTRPDGTYSSLGGDNKGDCRATIELTNDNVAIFETLAPGSTGILGGIGPGGWDWNPYGPPVMHMLVSGAAGHDSVLVHIPLLIDRTTLEPTSFWGPDWRGPAYFTPKRRPPFLIDSWEASIEENKVSLELSLFLAHNEEAKPVEDTLCKSFVYGLPSSFFLEPITICAPYLLDFFPL